MRDSSLIPSLVAPALLFVLVGASQAGAPACDPMLGRNDAVCGSRASDSLSGFLPRDSSARRYAEGHLDTSDRGGEESLRHLREPTTSSAGTSIDTVGNSVRSTSGPNQKETSS